MVLSRTFSWDDFYFAGPEATYGLRIDRLLQFNSGVVYGGKRLMWDTVSFRKCQELARYLLAGGRHGSFELTSTRPVLQGSDTHRLREKILTLSQSDVRKLGIGKSTLHYSREKAARRVWFRVYRKVRKKLMPQIPESTFSRPRQVASEEG